MLDKMNTPTNELNAEQAKKLSLEAIEKRFTSALREIRDAANDGYTSCILTRGCSPQLEAKLKALGFMCVRQGSSDTIKVNWQS